MNNSQFLLYQASAGSGKTETLAKEYLKLVLGRSVEFKNVLAITFTNKAAGEMKERVLKLLSLFAAGVGKGDYRWQVLDEIAKIADVSHEVISEKAGALHKSILHNYTDFSINTIDSFVHRIIRSFALELNLSYSFEVVLDTGEFVKMTIDDLLEKVGENRQLTEALLLYSKTMLEEEEAVMPESRLVSLTKFLTAEGSMTPLEKLANADVDMLNLSELNLKLIRKTIEKWDAIADKGIKAIADTNLPAECFSHGKRGGIYTFFSTLKEKRSYSRIFNREKESSRVNGYLSEGKSFASKYVTENEKDIIVDLHKTLVNVWNELCSEVDYNYQVYAARTLIQKNIVWLSLSKLINEQLEITMKRENVLPIYEFNRLIRNIIKNQPVPFIYERTSERYAHFLIDEFQDTSAMQWGNMLPLIDESLSKDGTTMIVGDAKQAIYRWRNGDVKQFIELQQLEQNSNNTYADSRHQAIRRHIEKENLTINYRSAEEIVEFNNIFFEWLSKKFNADLEDIYKGHAQTVGAFSLTGAVEISLIEKLSGESDSDVREKVLEQVVENVGSLINPENVGCSPSDICVLVRTNKEAALVANALVEAAIPVVSAESFALKIYDEPVVLRAITGLIADQTDNIQAAILATKFLDLQKITRQEYLNKIYQLNNLKDSVWGWVNQLLFSGGVGKTIGHYSALPIYEMCEEIIRDVFGSTVYPPAAQHLLDLTAAFVRNYGSDLAGYNVFLDKAFDESIPLPESKGSVQVMTIHKSKGLQFPVVIYPFANISTFRPGINKELLWVEDPDQDTFYNLPVLLVEASKSISDTPFAQVWLEEKSARIQDLANLSYVAFTRAQRVLKVIACQPSKSPDGEINLYDLLGEWVAMANQAKTIEQIGDNVWRLVSDTDSISLGEGWDMQDDLQTALDNDVLSWQSSGWQSRLRIKPESFPSEEEVSEENRSAIERGNLVHAILERLHTSEHLSDVIENIEERGLLRLEEKFAIFEEISGLINDDAVKPFFMPGVENKREAAILAPDGRQYRPDRVVKLGDGWAVLDYKTGEPHPSHSSQVKRYCDLLREMGHQNVKGYLLYTSTSSLVEV